jgi:hypothetical protein
MQSFDRLNHSSLVLEWKRLKLLVSVLSGAIFLGFRRSRFQKSKRTASCTSRFGSAAVNPRGALGDTLAVPCAWNGGPNVAPTMLLTLAKLVRFVTLKPSAVKRKARCSLILNTRAKRTSNVR